MRNFFIGFAIALLLSGAVVYYIASSNGRTLQQLSEARTSAEYLRRGIDSLARINKDNGDRLERAESELKQSIERNNSLENQLRRLSDGVSDSQGASRDIADATTQIRTILDTVKGR